MPMKSKKYAQFEAIQFEMRRNKLLCHFYEYQRPTAVGPGGKIIDLYREFKYPRVWDWGPIDEHWIAGCTIGAAVSGVPAIGHFPSMTGLYPAELTFNQAGKFYSMHGQQYPCPVVMWMDGSRRIGWSAAQHADVGQEAAYAAMPGITVVVPSTAYDAKGLMHAAIRSGDPVVYWDYSEITGPEDVPDGDYIVPIGEAAVRTTGKDITIVGYAPATVQIAKAMPLLKKAGISAEFIDPRTVKPLPIDTIIKSVKKTGRLLAVDHAHWTLGSGVQIIAEVAEAVQGAKFRRLAYPDSAVPGNKSMTAWMTPTEENIVKAAKKLM